MEDVHVFESTQDIVDFFEKRGTDKWKGKGGGGEKGRRREIKTSCGYLKNNFVSSECQIMRKSSQRDAIDALVDEEILEEEEAVQDVLREKNEENQGEGERHKSKLRKKSCSINTRIEDQSDALVLGGACKISSKIVVVKK